MSRAAVAIGGLLALSALAGLGIGGWDFLRQHWGALVTASLTVGATLWALGRLLGGIGRGIATTIRRRQLGESGAVMAEFVIVVIPFFLMFFGLMQMALASLARVLVSYAAFCAARAAIVIVPMGGSEVAAVGGASSSSSDEAPNQIGSGSNDRKDFSSSNKKAGLIRNAAAYAMIPASPAIDTVISDVVRNFPGYLANRLLHGIDPRQYLGSLGSIPGVSPAMLDSLSNSLTNIVQGGLDTPADRQKAKASIDSTIDGMTSDPATRAKLKSAAESYIDKYTGSAGSPTGGLGDWVQNQLNGMFGGSLDKYKTQVQNAVGGALGSVGLPGGKGAAVDRALDVGFGAGTDGAGGAILRSLRKLVYARMATVVTTHDENGAVKTKFGWNDPIKVRVTHLFYCQIPLANRFAGKPFYSLPEQVVADLATGSMKGMTVLGIPGFFLPITAEHTLVNQGRP